MKNIYLLVFVVSLPLRGQIPVLPTSKPVVLYTSTNFSTDLLGPMDNRPLTWGAAISSTKTITFNPPLGYRVEIVSLVGTVNAFPQTGNTQSLFLPFGSWLFGVQNTGPQGSVYCDLCADNTPLYIQGTISPFQASNVSFNSTFPGGYPLLADNKLVQVIASFLNVLGYLHIEASYTIGFKFVKINP